MKSKISIITPVYKVENYLEKCIRSVLSQTFSEWELILVDDNSPDNSPAICDKFAKEDSRIKVIHSPQNQGVASARMTGLKTAQGDYIMFLDSDDHLDNNTLFECFSLITSFDADVLETGYYIDFNKKSRAVSAPFDNREFDKTGALRELHNLNFMHDYLWNKIYKRSVIPLDLEINRKVNIGEDYDLLIRIYENCQKIVMVDKAFYHYEQRLSSVCNNGFNEGHIHSLNNWKKNSLYLCEKYPQIKNEVTTKILYQEMSLLSAMSKNKNYNIEVIKEIQNDVKSNYRLTKQVKNKPLSISLALFTVKFSPRLFMLLYSILRTIKK